MKKFILVLTTIFIVTLVFVSTAVSKPVFAKQSRRNLLALGKGNMNGKLINTVLTSIDGSNLTVTLGGKTYTITTSGKTDFRRLYWGKSALSEMSVNDKLNISGKFTDSTRTVMAATWVRDLSIMKRFGVFSGKITTLNTDNFVFNADKRGTQIVMFDQNTKFTNKTNKTISYSNLQVGDRVKVKGEWDKTLNKITQVTLVKDGSR